MRWTRAERNGLGLMTQLIDGFRSKGGEIVPDTEITRLTLENGRVTGLEGRDAKTGEPVAVSSKAVVVATGGFNSNLDMVLEHNPALEHDKVLEGSGRGLDRDRAQFHSPGRRLSHPHGPHLVLRLRDARLSRSRAAPRPRVSPGARLHLGQPARPPLSQRGAVGRQLGEPGADGAEPAPRLGDHGHADDARPWRSPIPTIATATRWCAPRWSSCSTTRRSSARPTRSPSWPRRWRSTRPTFLATVERYNHACTQRLETEPEFGKPLKSSKAFDTPPYYAVQIFPLARKNFGGVKTDLRCRVLDQHFEPIAGLYAAGEVAGMAGGHINGRAGLEGTMLGPSLFSGRVAGGWAAQASGHGGGFVGTPNRA